MRTSKIEIFSGTGGVGKTTLATSRALFLSRQDRKVLLMTIDPAKRLKQILNMRDEEAGEIQQISGSLLQDGLGLDHSFDALLMNPTTTMKRILGQGPSPRGFDNPIVQILFRPHGGMNEIMAMVEIQHHLSQESYETIILDTPPGGHFIDFLVSAGKIERFFGQAFVDIFEYLQKSLPGKEGAKKNRHLFTLAVQSGIKKLLNYLEKVTGQAFVEDFLAAIGEIYRHKKAFVSALELGENLKDKNFGHWFLVTSVEQQKFFEAHQLREQAQHFTSMEAQLVVNKCLRRYLDQWEIDRQDNPLAKLKNVLEERESKLKTLAAQHLDQILEFPEVLASSPGEQVCQLATVWGELEQVKNGDE